MEKQQKEYERMKERLNEISFNGQSIFKSLKIKKIVSLCQYKGVEIWNSWNSDRMSLSENQ